MKTIRILDLFAGTQSVRKALTKKYQIKNWNNWKEFYHAWSDKYNCRVEYIGVDIYSPEGINLIFDLTQDKAETKLHKLLPLNWTFNESKHVKYFIWASPLCTTFSRATCIKGGTLSYELNKDNRIIIRQNFKDITHKAYVKHKDNPEWIKIQQTKGKLGLSLLNNTKNIIDYFNVPFAIENPAQALSKYEYTEYKRNLVEYCRYVFPYKKSTAIYSSIEMKLKRCNHKNHEQVMSGWSKQTGIKSAPQTNKDRSRVPEELIISILEKNLI